MKYKILIAAFILFCSFTGPGDPPEVGISFKSYWRSKSVAIAGYTKINARYEWVAGAFDSGLHVPQYNGVPSGTRSGVWNADGAVAVDTSNHRLYFYSGGSWRYSTSGTGGGYTFTNGLTESAGTVKLGGTLTDATTTIDINGNILQVVDVGNSRFLMNPGTTSLYSPSEQSFLDLDDNTAKLTGKDSLVLSQTSGNIRMRNLNYTLSTVGKKIMLRDTATGLVQNIDASLLTGATPTLQQVLTAGSTLTTNNTVDGGGNSLVISSASPYTSSVGSAYIDTAQAGVNVDFDGKSAVSEAFVLNGKVYANLTSSDTTIVSAGTTNIKIGTAGGIKITPLNYTLSTTGKKIMLRDTATGLVQNIDPALLGGSISLAAIGSSPNANGATISGSTLNLEPASASFGGVVTTGTQSFAGTKTFTGIVGIGASPTYNLDVFGGGFYGTVRIRGASGGGFIMGDWNSNTGGFWSGGITPTVSNYSILANNAGNTFINAASGQLVYLLTNNGTGTAGAVLGDNGLAINSGLIAPTSGNSLIVGSGRVGIGTVSPTAFFHIKAGTSSAQTAPLKFTSGTNLTTAEAGAVEYDGKDLFFTPTGTIRKVIPTIISSRSTGQTAAVASVATQTVGASDASFMVSANILVTTSSAEAFTTTVAYTDEGNTARTLTLNYSLLAGTIGVTIAAANGAVPYQGVPVQIRCKASTTITIATTGTFTGCTYNVEGTIQKIQ